MAVKRATLVIESTGQNAHFEAGDESELLPGDVHPPVLIVEVADFDEAVEFVDTLNRSRAQKKRERKPAETAAPERENGKPAGERLAAVGDKT